MAESTPSTASTQAPDVAEGAGRKRCATHPAFISLLIAALTLAVFWPAVHARFVSFDDPDYVTENAHVKGGLTASDVAWAFRTGHAGNWHPLTWMSHMLDAQLFALNPACHHLTNVLFHAANSVLLFAFFLRITGALWRSAFVAALFALHPLHVESVAWVSERKDVLSAFFFLLTLLFYGKYVLESRVLGLQLNVTAGEPPKDGPPTTGPSTGATANTPQPPALEAQPRHDAPRFTFHVSLSYFLSLGFLALGLMSKPMLVTVPFVLLLLDFWPLRRFGSGERSAESGAAEEAQAGGGPSLSTLRPLLWEKAPFFALSIASCLVTLVVQGEAEQPLANLSIGARFGNMLVAYVRYLGKTLWPLSLAAPYPHPGHWPLGEVVFAGLLLGALTLTAVWSAKRFPFATTGWFWFVGMMVPVIGLVQVGEQSMADRYTYLPLIGLFVVLAWAGGEISTRRVVPPAACGTAAILILGMCAARSRDQLRWWQNSESLYRHAVAVTKKNFIAYYNLGSFLDSEGEIDEAMTNYFKAVEIQPHYPDPLNNIGCAYANRKRFGEALPYFEAALRSKPDFTSAHENIANALRELGRYDEAIPHFKAVVEKKPEDTGALNSLGNALAHQGKYAEAIPFYEASLRAKPEQAAAHYDLANALARLRRTDEAIGHYRLAIQQKANYALAHHDLAIALFTKGKPEEALVELREAVRWQPTNAVFLLTFGKVLAAGQKFDEAISVFTEAVRLVPGNADGHSALGSALATSGKLGEAIAQFELALRLRPENPATHFNLGKALAAEGKFEQARYQLTEALRLKPDFAAARQELRGLPGQTVP